MVALVCLGQKVAFSISFYLSLFLSIATSFFFLVPYQRLANISRFSTLSLVSFFLPGIDRSHLSGFLLPIPRRFLSPSYFQAPIPRRFLSPSSKLLFFTISHASSLLSSLIPDFRTLPKNPLFQFLVDHHIAICTRNPCCSFREEVCF